MGIPRFQSRFALLDLELRRLWREPWLAYASVMLVPLFLTFLMGGVGVQAAPGVQIFRALCWWWCLAAHVVFIPLMGLAFWGEERRDENEALRVAGFSTAALFSGVLGSRLVTALAVLLIPAPLLVLCYLLGGLTGSGLLAACLHLPLHFFFLASLYALLGVTIRRSGLYWVLCLLIALLFITTTHAGTIVAGAPRAVLLATRMAGAGSRVAVELAGTGLVALLLLGCACAALARRLRVGEGSHGHSRRASRWLRPRVRPTPADAVRWKERWFGLGGLAGYGLRRLWGPVAVLLLVALPYALLAGSTQAQNNLVFGYALLLLLGLIFSLAHGILSAHRLFAQEKQDQTLDALLLARGSAFGIVHEKLQEYRASSLQLWYSCLFGLYLSLLFVATAAENFDVFAAVFFLSLFGAPFAFMFFRMQEGFATALFRTWSRSERMPAVTLLREAALFVGSTVGYLILVPGSMLAGLMTFVFAIVVEPMLIYAWIKHFNQALRRRQRDLIRDFCEGCADLSFEVEMARHYGAPPPRKPSVFFPAGPPPPRPGPGAYTP